jgi:hypothetical protein
MGMPQKEACENRYLWMPDGNGAYHFCYRGVANLIHFMAGRVNSLWNVAGSAPATFFLEPIPTQADNRISSTVR